MPMEVTNQRWGTANGSVTWDALCDADILDVQTSDIKVLLIQAKNTDPHGNQWNNEWTRIQYRDVTAGGSWTDVAVGNDWEPYDTAAFADDDAVTAALCADPGGTWVNGKKDEDSALRDGLAGQRWTEHWFCIKPTNAVAGHEYEFRWWNYTSGVAAACTTPSGDWLKATIYTAAPSETIVAKEFPMGYYQTTGVKDLRSKVSGATVVEVAKNFPPLLLKSGKAKELTSKWS